MRRRSNVFEIDIYLDDTKGNRYLTNLHPRMGPPEKEREERYRLHVHLNFFCFFFLPSVTSNKAKKKPCENHSRKCLQASILISFRYLCRYIRSLLKMFTWGIYILWQFLRVPGLWFRFTRSSISESFALPKNLNYPEICKIRKIKATLTNTPIRMHTIKFMIGRLL